MKVVALLALFVCAVSAKSVNVGTFSYNNCNAADPIQVTDLSATPDPIVVPGSLTISITVEGTVDVTSPTDFNVLIEKSETTGWVKLPCDPTLNVGSCDYPDVCDNLGKRFPNGAGCPAAITDSGLNCNCPITAGTYDINNLVIDLTTVLPNMATGDYHVNAKFTAGGGEIACLDIYASVEVK